MRTPFCSQPIDGTDAAAWLSPDPTDPEWDAFLQETPLGQFQQSSLWAVAKKVEGWKHIRMVITLGGRIAGGFQILTRRTRLGAVGYVYKGPVVVPETPALLDFVVGSLVQVAAANRLRALLVQPADASKVDEALLARHDFLPNHLIRIISATLVVDLSPGMEAVGRRIRRTLGNEIRQARRKGVTVREGTDQDVGKFFELMVSTCQRQRTPPAPATAAALHEAWKAFRPAGLVRLLLAECDGETVAGMWCFCFGQTVTLWKKGWSGACPERHPNALLNYEALRWACEAGYRFADFAALDDSLAATLAKGEPMTERHKTLRDFFNLGFGGRPVLLPKSQIYIRSPAARLIYRLGGSRVLLRISRA